MTVIQTSKHSFIEPSPVTSVRHFRALGLGRDAAVASRVCADYGVSVIGCSRAALCR
jgi:hypothetical protein